MKIDKDRVKPGPKEERVKVDGSWEDAAKKAVKKKRPKEGWPPHKESETKSKPD